MKNFVLSVGLFLSLQVSLYAQTYYINGTTDSSLGNKALLHTNELKIGNSTSATERAKNMIKFGDASYIQIGEWEADDLLSFKASRYNFTNGKVGIGTTSPAAQLEISGDNPAFILRGTPTFLQIGVPSANGNYAPYSKRGDVVFRPLSGVDGHKGLILNISSDLADGKSYIKFGDDKNHGWFSIYNNKIAVINGKLGIGVENPIQALEVNGTIKATALNVNSLTTVGDLRIGSVVAPANTYGKMLYFGTPGENGDNMFISRFNVASDASELRVSVGDDYNDKFIVGRKFWDQPEFEPMFTVVTNGNVGIGTSNPVNKLDVKGVIRATEVKIETGWADFVFNDDYRLKPLSEVNTFIKENRHLPEIPSAAEVKENEGVNLGEMQVKLLQKIEELTLYLIQQENTIQELKSEIRELKEK
jgi:hypothetical protein